MIMCSFVACYSFQTVWNIVDVSGFYIETPFVDILMGDLIVPAFCNFLPIFIVLFAHFKNITSLARLLSLPDESETDSLDCDVTNEIILTRLPTDCDTTARATVITRDQDEFETIANRIS